MAQDIMTLVFVWLLTFVWQYLAFPWWFQLTQQKLADGGWSFARISGWLVISLLVWFLAHFGLAVNQSALIWIITLLVGLVTHSVWKKQSGELVAFLKKRRVILIVSELFFALGFFVLPFIRAHHPQIIDLEKFMDAGLMVSYAKSPTLPLLDMWLAGEKFNYYTFGHFMGALASQFWRLPVEVSYNVLLGLVAGLVMSQVFGLVVSLVYLTRPKATLKALVASGIAGVLLVAIGGNGHALWYVLKNLSFSGYWYPDATRFIDRTIHEFPSYSFIVSDLHAHVWSLPLVLLTLVVIGLWLSELLTSAKRQTNHWWQLAVGVGGLLGVLLMTSSWDGAIYSLFLAFVGILVLFREPRLFGRLLLSAVVMVLLMIVTSSMWWLNFESISEGVRVAKEQSPLWQLGVLWGIHGFTSVLAFIAAGVGLRTAKTNSGWWVFIIALILTATALLLLPELIYMKDIYPNHPRANTMFKLTFQAFTIMGIVIAWLVGVVQSSPTWNRWLAWCLRGWLLLVLVAVLLYPYFGYRDYYDRLKTYQGLDGLQWLATDHPTDYAAIVWLNQTVKGRPVVVEAVGESYTTFARVSTFTGLPTILGWRVHEWLWRGGFDIPGQRTEEVRKIYEEPTSEPASVYLNQYQVRFIFVGDKEREAYKNIDETGLKSFGRIVFQQGTTYIIDRQAW